ncbi:hypothetical protein EYF80_002724 [Liparis tanakae]|uniref:Uncharacterized protein n=1 Tax=Liparis tanakae TaxID=230148 RepID=A0A4Z2J9S6_9TELE|nr:hypothetical protein EYF80_002724 [Liparis tanakae]
MVQAEISRSCEWSEVSRGRKVRAGEPMKTTILSLDCIARGAACPEEDHHRPGSKQLLNDGIEPISNRLKKQQAVSALPAGGSGYGGARGYGEARGPGGQPRLPGIERRKANSFSMIHKQAGLGRPCWVATERGYRAEPLAGLKTDR